MKFWKLSQLSARRKKQCTLISFLLDIALEVLAREMSQKERKVKMNRNKDTSLNIFRWCDCPENSEDFTDMGFELLDEFG